MSRHILGMLKNGHTFTTIEQGATLSKPDMRVLCYMAIASELFNTACDNYSEGEEIEDVIARLETSANTIDTILQTIKETR